jgi:site-specific DNA recombinase
MTKTIAFYARVSTEEQRERSTIDAQVDYARKRAVAEGWTLQVFLDDGISGTIPLARRPAGAALLRAVQARQVDAVATYRVDRLGRTLRVVLDAIDALAAVPYHSLTEPFDTATPIGRAMLSLVGVFAELERETFLERSLMGTHRVARESGRWLGGIVPFGYRKREDLTISPDESPLGESGTSTADVVRDVFRLCGVEGWSTVRIAADLNARHIPTSYVRDGREAMIGATHGTRSKDGKRKRATAGVWSAGAVLRLLHNETYAGRHRYGKRTKNKSRLPIDRDMPAIISPALFARVHQQLTMNYQWSKAHARRDYPLRGLLVCACGHVLLGTVYETKKGEVRQYRCSAHPKGARPVRVYAEAAEAALWSDVEDFFAHPTAVLRSIAVGKSDGGADAEKHTENQLVRLANDLRDVGQQIERSQDDYAQAVFRPDEIATKVTTLREQQRGLHARMESLREARKSAARSAADSDDTRRLLRSLAQRAKSASPQVRADILRTLIRGSRAEWQGDAVKLNVTYAFDQRPVAATIGTDRGSSPRRA